MCSKDIFVWFWGDTVERFGQIWGKLPVFPGGYGVISHGGRGGGGYGRIGV